MISNIFCFFSEVCPKSSFALPSPTTLASCSVCRFAFASDFLPIFFGVSRSPKLRLTKPPRFHLFATCPKCSDRTLNAVFSSFAYVAYDRQ